MTDQESHEDQSRDTWQDIGKEFEQLGGSIAQALRSAWSDENNRRRAHEMQAGLEVMIREVGDAIRDTANTPQGQQLRQDAVRAADTLVNAGEEAAHELRPHLLTALKQVNETLQNLVSRMEQREGQPKPPTEQS